MAPRKKRGRTIHDIIEREERNNTILFPIHDDDDDLDEHIESTVKKGRGPAKGIESWGTGVKTNLIFNKLMQPVGTTQKEFSSQLGIIARNGVKTPLNYESWTDIPTDYMDKIWKEIQDNTNAPPEYRSNCLKSVGHAWKNWKARMKADYFTPYVNDDNKLEVTPPRLVASQWKELVKYWKSEHAKEIAEKNKQNREKMNFIYRKGRNGYASVRYEMEQKGEDTSRSNVWIKTHTPKLGVQVDPNTEVVMSELRERLGDIPIEEMTHAQMEQIFQDVVGEDKRGRVQTFGLGPSRKDVFEKPPPMPSPEMIEKIREEVRGEMMEEMKGEFENYIKANMATMFQSYLENLGISIPSSCIQVPGASSAHQPNSSGASAQNLSASVDPHEGST